MKSEYNAYVNLIIKHLCFVKLRGIKEFQNTKLTLILVAPLDVLSCETTCRHTFQRKMKCMY